VTIGDTPRDIAAAKAAGTTAYGVRTGHGCQHTKPDGEDFPPPDRMFDDVGAAVAFATRPLPAKRILYVVSEDWYFLSHRLPMARAARDAGFDVHVATNVRNGAEAIAREGFTLHAVPFVRGRVAPGGIFATIRALRRVHRAVKPDIVHRVALQPTVLDALAAIGMPGASVNAITGLGHTFIADTFKARLLRGMIGFVLRHLVNGKSGIALVQNPDDTKLMSTFGFPPERIALIPGSGVDIVHLQPQPEPDGPPTVGFVGRLLADKGIRTLIEALRIVRSKIPDARLVVAGTPDPANPASIPERELAQWRREPGITFLGHVTDIASVWARAHIAVLPSRREGFPKSLLEAAACGRAMVATDVPGCREIVIPDETGLLVPSDDAAALAQAIQTLLASPELRKRMGATARRLAETRFSTEAIGSATVDLYRRLADNTA
jgi:glycosyltransferase involved in cell wall biosynthesis